MSRLNQVTRTIFEGFSVKKFLLCILCSIIVTTFVGFTYLFVREAIVYTQLIILNEVSQDSEMLKVLGTNMQENVKGMKEEFKSQKEEYGEDYPAEGIFLYRLFATIRSSIICEMYALTLLVGIIVGTAVYIIFIQKAKGVQMLVESVILGMLIIVLIALLNIGYSSLINILVSKIIGNGDSNLSYAIYDIDNSNMLYVFIGTIGIAYIINLIYQKMLAKKLNQKLNKNN